MKLAETTSCCSWLLVLRYVHTHSMVHIHSVVQPLPGSGWEGWLQQPNPAAATTVATAATERLQPLPLHLPKKASPICHNTLTCASMVLPVLGAPYSSRLLMCGRRSWTTWLPRGRMANSATAWRTCKGDAQMQKPYGGRCDLPKSSQRPHSASAAAR